MFRRPNYVFRFILTFTILAVAVLAGVAIWNHYLTGPWTRDGQVLAYVVDMAPEVSGRVVKLNVADNQSVHKDDVLYQIDPVDYQVAVANAEANVQGKLTALQNSQAQATRRDHLTTLTTSEEEKQTYTSNANAAVASYAAAVSQLNQAKINLERTTVHSEVNGYVTNLQLRVGDYATAGTRNLSLLDSDSFWVVGYFEETKIAGIHVGDPAYVALMGYRDAIRGHVESIAHGINTPNTAPGSLGLASVDPVFTWVRLAQRVPIRIHIDYVPDTVLLAAGLTATITVGPQSNPHSNHGLISRLLTMVAG
ncbi:biotin/lipoyl-binding protein [Rhodopila sp.]|uniref:efflux RND transporter periplasmic adaptor subunit n=1 Tax=Rhodopila sp. TaxID=2480087 RepID=UPI003D14A511